MFEITQIAARDTFTLELKNGNGDVLLDASGAPLSVTVYGPGSKAFRQAQAERNQRMIDRMAKAGKTRLSAEENQRETALFLAACTVSFNGWCYQGKNDAHAIEAAYLDPAIGFIADQVGAAIPDWANFTSSSPQS